MMNFRRRELGQMCMGIVALPLANALNSCERRAFSQPIKEPDASRLPEDVRSLVSWVPEAQVSYIPSSLSAELISSLDEVKKNSPAYLTSGSTAILARGERRNVFKAALALHSSDGLEKVLWWLESNDMMNKSVGVIYGDTIGIAGVRFNWEGSFTLDNKAIMRADVLRSSDITIGRWSEVLKMRHNIFEANSGRKSEYALKRLALMLGDQNLSVDVEGQRQIQREFNGT